MREINTFSIAAYDADAQEWGIAVASKFLAVGTMVCWARAGAGAVATQAMAKISYGPDGLALMAQGKSAQETLEILIANDPYAAQRQVGLVDAHGNAAAHTGAECHAWAGHRIGAGYTSQGNILTGAETIDALAETFESAEGELADRLLAALVMADQVGGDKRGKQAAALVVVRAGGGYGGDNDRYLDLRVDDHFEPVAELERLLDIHHLFFGKVNPDDLLPIGEDLAGELQNLLRNQGLYSGDVNGVWDEASKQAFWGLVGNENLEERWHIDEQPDMIDIVALEYLREKFG